MIPEKVIAELWKRGELDWRLEPQQRELLNGIRLPHVEIVYGDFTRRGGKTDACATFVISEALKSKTKIRYAAAFQSDLSEFIKPAFDTVLESCPEALKPVFLDSKKAYRFANGSEIKLIGLDKNPNGYNCDNSTGVNCPVGVGAFASR